MYSDWFYFSFSILYLIHMHEEYWTGFTKKLPPPRLVGNFADRGFWILNPLLLTVTTAWGVANLMGATWAFFWISLWSSICLWNAVAHATWSLFTRKYQPGLITGAMYAPLFIIWTWMLTIQGNTDWNSYLSGLLIGLVVTIILASFAYVGHRIFRINPGTIAQRDADE